MELRKVERSFLGAVGVTGRTAAQDQSETGSILDRPWVFRTLLILALSVFVGANITLNHPRIRQLMGGLPILDMRFWYSEPAVYRLLDVLGHGGRGIYLKLLWSFDLCAPILFGMFLSAASRRTSLRRFSRVPFLATGFDYAENIAITVLLLRYPAHLPSLVLLASVFTLLKWTFSVASILGLVVGLIHRLRQRAFCKPDRLHGHSSRDDTAT